MVRKYTIDFETASHSNEETYIWAWGICSIDKNYDFNYGNTMDELFTLLENSENNIFYFHNLRFDGKFIIDFLLRNGYEWVDSNKKAKDRSFTTLISNMNQFYSIEVYFSKNKRKVNKVTFYDSLKILPFSVEQIAKDFNLPIQKEIIDYKKYRPKIYKMTDEEISYLKNDVTIVAKALYTIFEDGHTKMTQGSNALADFKKIKGEKSFKIHFPVLDFEIDRDIRRSYRGGFTWCNPIYQGQTIENGIVLDVNSLYPSVMYNKLLPYGVPIFFKGKYKKDKYYPLYVQQLECRFKIKKDYIPTLQIKKDPRVLSTEYLYEDVGEPMIITLTSVDLELFFKHYDVWSIEYLSGWKFKGIKGYFKDYIDKWSEIKIKSKENDNYAMYILSKLMLNSLYGKLALNPVVASKIPILDKTENIVKYVLSENEIRDSIYIPMGTFITAYARFKTITSAQKVYNRFLYADTDSLHLIGTDIPKELEIDSTKLGAWDYEFRFTKARFIRSKRYIEEGYKPNKPEKIITKVTCAGLPSKLHDKVTFDNFVPGMIYPGKLVPKDIKGGVILQEVDFTLKI